MSEPSGVNVPLLRKAVEWAEAEAMKPPELCEWVQNSWVRVPDSRVYDLLGYDYPVSEAVEDAVIAHCGTAYCIAGYVAQSLHEGYAEEPRVGGVHVSEFAAEALGIPVPDVHEMAGHLFYENNTADDIRRIAEELAGERL